MLGKKILAYEIEDAMYGGRSGKLGTGNAVIPNYPDGFIFKDSKVGDVFSALLPYVYVIAGIILLVMLIMGGLELMTAAGNPDKMKAGYGKITNALIGFLIIFVSYFIVQLLEMILGIKIL